MGSTFDRYWIEGLQRSKLRKREDVEAITERLREIKAKEGSVARKIEMFKLEVSLMGATEAQRVEAARLAEEEEQKNATVEDKNWTKEDIANLTKAIAKFPPGTSQRWAVIAE